MKTKHFFHCILFALNIKTAYDHIDSQTKRTLFSLSSYELTNMDITQTSPSRE